MAAICLTEQQVSGRYGCSRPPGGVDSNKLCTKQRANYFGLTVLSPSPCASNQIVTNTNRCTRSNGGGCNCS